MYNLQHSLPLLATTASRTTTFNLTSRASLRAALISRTMASAPSPQSLPEAPWKADFLAHMKEMGSPEFVFSSLAPAPKGSSTPYVPRARYCIYRSMWAQLPDNKHNEAPMNERVYESDMPCFTSDVRMNKVFEVFASSAGKADDTSLTQGSGGGGPCEAVWWVKTDNTKVQWRMKGNAYIIGNDISGAEESSGVRTVKTELFSRMRVVKEEGKSDWSWAKELTGHFGNTPPGTRGTFKAPPPGQQVDKPYSKDLQPGQVKSLDDETARSNFRVVVIKPDEVEMLDLTSSDPSESRRFVYTFNETSGSWDKEECWP